MKIKLSTIIPIYNKSKALGQTLQSVVDNHQIDDSEYECILVDDESTDDSSEICKSFCKEYPYFKYLRIFNNGNRTPSDARNVGLRFCRGEFIHFLDADDTLCETFYPDGIGVMETTGVDIFLRGYYIRKEDGTRITFQPYTFTDITERLFGPPLGSCIFRNYVKDIEFESI